jgi:hypothetical protein
MASILDQATANVRRRRRRALRRWLERHPSARVAARGGRWAWRRRDRVAAAARWTGRGFRAAEATAINCDYCGRSVPAADAEKHIERHNRAARAAAARQDTRQSTGRKPSPRPRPPAEPGPSRPAPHPAVSTGRNSTVATQETITLARAARAVGEMDPQTAWELDAELAGMASALLTLAENVGQWVERLDVIKVDPRVTGPTADAIAQLAEASGTFSRSRLIFRRLYSAQFEAAETNVRQIRREDFWDQNAA